MPRTSRQPKKPPKNPKRAPARSRPWYARTSLHLEILEDRTAPAAGPTIFNVDTFADTAAVNLTTGADSFGTISLRSALMAANATPGADIINLPAGTYNLTLNGANENLAETGDLDILDNVTIRGAGAGLTIIDAGSIDRAFENSVSVTATLDGMTLQNGFVVGMGGAILNSGALTLSNSVVQESEARGEAGGGNFVSAGLGGTVNGFGGGIFNSGTLTLYRSTVQDNVARGGQGGSNSSWGSGGGGGGMGAGGGIFNDNGTVLVDSSTIAYNLARGGTAGVGGPGFGGHGHGGGGAGGDGGFGGNDPTSGTDGNFGGGGGSGGSNLDFAPGGNGGDGGWGGGGGGAGSGIPDGGGYGGDANDNSGGFGNGGGGNGGDSGDTGGGGGGGGAGNGGGLFNENGTVLIRNSTFSGNVAEGGNGSPTHAYGGGDGGSGGNGQGGAVFTHFGAVTVESSTVADNAVAGGEAGGFYEITGSDPFGSPGSSGSGLGAGFVNEAGTLSLVNTILATNFVSLGEGSFDQDFTGILTSQGYNLIGSGNFDNIQGNLSGVLFGANPSLGSLQDNGGPTATHAPNVTSPALNAGNGEAAPTVDQRGAQRQNQTDIGAFEQYDYVVTNTNNSGPGSLRQAIETNNSSENGGNTIRFLIGTPGTSHTIQVVPTDGLIGLPSVNKPLVLDGWSQGGAGYQGPPLIELDGTYAIDDYGTFGFNIQSSDVTVRGFAINNFPEFNGNGFGIGVFGVVSNIHIYGNFIGTDITGSQEAGNGQGGIWVGVGPTGVIIGTNGDGTNDAAEGNVISGNFGDGILLQGSNNIVAGNFIGVGADGIIPLNNFGAGIFVTGSNNRIGTDGDGTSDALEGNVITFNGTLATGVHVAAGTGNSIRRNSIHSNVGLGIDLDIDGVTDNDADDADSGPNNLQNFPVIDSISLDSENVVIEFSVPTSADEAAYPLTVDFYIADGFGQEGWTWIGSATIDSLNAGLPQTATFADPGLIPTDEIVATATDAAGNTSEFSAAVGFDLKGNPPTGLQATADPDTIPEGQSITFTGSFMDADSRDGHDVFIHLGVSDTSAILIGSLPPGQTSFSIPFTFTDNLSFNPTEIQLIVRDATGLETSTSLPISVTNADPTGQLTNDGPVSPGGTATVTFVNVADPSEYDTQSGFLYSYDFDNDGKFEITDAQSASAVVPAEFLANGTVRGRITDKDGGFVDLFTSITVQGPPEVVLPADEAFPGVNTVFQLTFSVTGPVSEGYTVTVNFGDDSPPEQVSPGTDGSFAVSRVYTREGSFTLTVSLSNGEEVTSQDSMLVHVLPATPNGADTGTENGGVAVAVIPGFVLGTLFTSSKGAMILVAVLPNEAGLTPAEQAVLAQSDSDALVILATFDVRVINASPNDTVVVSFRVQSPDGRIPLFQFIDPDTGAKVTVRGSRNVPGSLQIIRLSDTLFEFRVVIDRTSLPSITDLFATVFSFSGTRPPPENSTNLTGVFQPPAGNNRISLVSNTREVVTPVVSPVNISAGVQSEQAVSAGASNSSSTSSGGESDSTEDMESLIGQVLQWIEDIHLSAWSAAGPQTSSTPRERQGADGTEKSAEDALRLLFSEFARPKEQNPVPANPTPQAPVPMEQESSLDSNDPWAALFAEDSAPWDEDELTPLAETLVSDSPAATEANPALAALAFGAGLAFQSAAKPRSKRNRREVDFLVD